MEGCCTCTRGRFFERFNIGDVKEVGNGELISLERNVREKLIKYTRRLDLFSLFFLERERERFINKGLSLIILLGKFL